MLIAAHCESAIQGWTYITTSLFNCFIPCVCWFTSFSVDFHHFLSFKIPITKCIPLNWFSVMTFSLHNFENMKHFLPSCFLISMLMFFFIYIFSAFLHLLLDDSPSQFFLGFSTYWFPRPYSKTVHLFTSLCFSHSTKFSSWEHRDKKKCHEFEDLNSPLYFWLFFLLLFSSLWHILESSTFDDHVFFFYFLWVSHYLITFKE